MTSREYFVYILTNAGNKVFYIGVTNNLSRRLDEHKQHSVEGFTAKYKLHKLVYYESTNVVYEAITREKQLKRWRRSWKEKLIESFNPTWRDLGNELE
jgi:putative endonuclease